MTRPTDLTRRRLMALATATTAGLAGCSGGGGDGGDGGDGGGGTEAGDGSDGADGSDGGDTTEEGTAGGESTTTGESTGGTDEGTADGDAAGGDGDATATDEPTATSEPPSSECVAFEPGAYTRFDGTDEPMIATFEYPAGEGSGLSTMSTVNGLRSATIVQNVDGERFYVFVEQYLDGTAERTRADRGETDRYEQFDTLSFGGEVVPLVRSTSPGQFGYTVYGAGLPYEHDDGTTLYYHLQVNATADYAQSLESGQCNAVWEATAEQIIGTLESNPDTTIEEERS